MISVFKLVEQRLNSPGNEMEEILRDGRSKEARDPEMCNIKTARNTDTTQQ